MEPWAGHDAGTAAARQAAVGNLSADKLSFAPKSLI